MMNETIKFTERKYCLNRTIIFSRKESKQKLKGNQEGRGEKNEDYTIFNIHQLACFRIA